MRYNIDNIRKVFDDAVKLGLIQSWSRRRDTGGRYVPDEWNVIANVGTVEIRNDGDERMVMKSGDVILKSSREAWLFAHALTSAISRDEAVRQGRGQ